jgi:hypothetical protein
MQAVGIILVLISIGTIVAPIGVVAYTYRDNLLQLVVPPQLDDVMNGGIFSNNVTNINNSDLGNSTDLNSGFVAPVIVNQQIDKVARTLTLTVNFTNTFTFNLDLNQFSADVVCSQHNFQLGSVQLSNPVVIDAGQTAQLFITGAWSQDAENHFTSDHPGAASIDVKLVNITIDVNGITIQQTEPVSIGSVPIN